MKKCSLNHAYKPMFMGNTMTIKVLNNVILSNKITSSNILSDDNGDDFGWP